MKLMIAFAIGILLKIGLDLLAKSKTRVGGMLRRSDRAAWQYAVEDKRQELHDLLSVEPEES